VDPNWWVQIRAGVGFLDLLDDRFDIKVIGVAMKNIARQLGPAVVREAEDSLVHTRWAGAWLQLFDRDGAPEELRGEGQSVEHGASYHGMGIFARRQYSAVCSAVSCKQKCF
jgi:hypothetical protein